MKFAAVISAALMILSEVVSQLTSTSYASFFYVVVGVDVEHVNAICSVIVPVNDMHQCYIDGMRPITYMTRWPYVMAYTTLFLLSFYSVQSYLICLMMSFLFMAYGFIVDGFNAVAPWVNLFVLLICAYRARRIIYGT